MTLTGYHAQAHFRANDLELYYNFPMEPPKGFAPCHHIEKLVCSKAQEFSPGDCINVRKCELEQFKDQLFRKYGIHGPTLLKVDKILREKKD